MLKNEIIPRGSLDRIGECEKCKQTSRLHLMEITMQGKTDYLSFCINCYIKLIEIASDE